MASEHGKKVPVGFEKPFFAKREKSNAPKVGEVRDDLKALDKVEDERAKDLIAAGFDSFQKIKNATLKQLTDIDGIGRSTARAIKESAELLG